MMSESSVRGRVGFVRRLLSARGMTACRWMSRRSPLRSARARWRSLLDHGLASGVVSRRPGALDWPDPLISAGPLLGWRPQDDAPAALPILDRGEIPLKERDIPRALNPRQHLIDPVPGRDVATFRHHSGDAVAC